MLLYTDVIDFPILLEYQNNQWIDGYTQQPPVDAEIYTYPPPQLQQIMRGKITANVVNPSHWSVCAPYDSLNSVTSFNICLDHTKVLYTQPTFPPGNKWYTVAPGFYTCSSPETNSCPIQISTR